MSEYLSKPTLESFPSSKKFAAKNLTDSFEDCWDNEREGENKAERWMFVMVSKRLHFSGCTQTKARESFFLRLSLEALWLKLLFVLQIFASPKDVCFLFALFPLHFDNKFFVTFSKIFFFCFLRNLVNYRLQMRPQKKRDRMFIKAFRHTHKTLRSWHKRLGPIMKPLPGLYDGRKENWRQNKQQKCLVNFKPKWQNERKSFGDG